MPRPKGSKNRKINSTSKDFATQLDELKSKADELERTRIELETEQSQLTDSIMFAQEEIRKKQDALAKNKKAIAAINRELEKLGGNSAEIAALAAATAKKEEIERKVTSLINAGLSADDLLEALQEHDSR